MILLDSVDDLLEHIEDVQKDVIGLSEKSLLKMTSYIEKHNIEVDDDISTALQYQDIITQQLNATVEAIENMRSDMKVLQDKLNSTLAEAKDKKSRFSGQTSSNEVSETIEFF